jgi:hypothetical protein
MVAIARWQVAVLVLGRCLAQSRATLFATMAPCIAGPSDIYARLVMVFGEFKSKTRRCAKRKELGCVIQGPCHD